jgi:Xaa-Pro aminopeptidase
MPESRIERLRQSLHSLGADAFLVSAPENRRYLSGFSGSSGYLIVTFEEALLATDFRYIQQAERQAPDYHVRQISGGCQWLAEIVGELGSRRIAYESDNMTVAAHQAAIRAVRSLEPPNRPELVATENVVDELRAVKDQEEIDLIDKAVEIADLALGKVAPSIEPGRTESQVAWEIEKAMRELGAESNAFDIIVGAGPNGSLPHHRADDTVIRPGDPIVIDMGATYQGYRSDLTRTFCVGGPDERFREVYDIVLGAQLAAEEAVRPGVTGGEIDAVARDFIDDAGYGNRFGHGLGHGVGLAVHELPRIGPGSPDILTDGMVFTIEPGVYLPEWGGVRIEDVVSIENGQVRVVSGSPK